MMKVSILKTISTWTYNAITYEEIIPMLRQMVKDGMTMAQIRKHLLDLEYDEDEVAHIMKNQYVAIIS